MANDILVKVGADITQFSKAMEKANKSVKEFGDKNKATFDSFKQVGAAVTGAGLAIAGGLGYAVKQAVDFESSFAGVNSLPSPLVIAG